MKPEPCRCERLHFPHRRESKCEAFEHREDVARTYEAMESGTYRSWQDIAADEAGVPRFGPI
jgi:hypothetical protein